MDTQKPEVEADVGEAGKSAHDPDDSLLAEENKNYVNAQIKQRGKRNTSEAEKETYERRNKRRLQFSLNQQDKD